MTDDTTPPDPAAVTPHSRHLDPEDPAGILRAYELMAMRQIALRLSPDEEDVFEAVVFGDKTMTEIERETGVPRNTAIGRYKSALAFLADVRANCPAAMEMFDELHELHCDG